MAGSTRPSRGSSRFGPLARPGPNLRNRPNGSSRSAPRWRRCCIADAWWLKQRRGTLAARRFELGVAYFAALALFLVGDILFQEVRTPWEASALALAAIVATGFGLSPAPAGSRLARPGLSRRGVRALGRRAGRSRGEMRWWSRCSALGLAHWWQWQRVLPRGRNEHDRYAALCLRRAGGLADPLELSGSQRRTLDGRARGGVHRHSFLWLGHESVGVALCGQAFALVAVFSFAERLLSD